MTAIPTDNTIEDSPNLRLAAIQFLRFVAAFMVVVFHANIFVNIIYPRPATDPLVMFSLIGTAGVPIFFTISGFIVFYTSRNAFTRAGAVPAFLKRRILRIYPIYWIALAAVLILTKSWEEYWSVGRTFWDALGTLLLLPGSADAVISPAWTLTYELFFYGLFGVLLFLQRNVAVLALTGIFTITLVLGRFLHIDETLPWLRMVTNPILLEFLAGVFIGWIFVTKPVLQIVAKRAIVWLLLIGALIGFAMIPFLAALGWPKLISLGVPGALAVAWAVLAEKMGMIPVFVRKLSFLGDSSYSLYLIHILVMSLLMPLAERIADSSWGTPLTVLSMYTGVSVLVGIAMNEFCEKPLQSFLRRKVIQR
ncbi:MAG: acyltransferase family protein [Marinosulfonomonas sp.]